MDKFCNGGLGSPNGKGPIFGGGIRQHNVGLLHRKKCGTRCGCSVPAAE